MNIINSGYTSSIGYSQQTKQTALDLNFAGQQASLQVNMSQQTLTADIVTLSGQTGEDAQTGNIASKAVKSEGDSPIDRQQELFRSIIEKVTGKQVKNLESHHRAHGHDHGDKPSAPVAQSGADAAPQAVDISQASLSVSTVSVSAEGSIRTADGKQLSFSLDLSLTQASLSAQSLSVRNGADGQPLVVDYNGTSAELSSSSFSFSFSLQGDVEGAAGEKGEGSIKFAKPLLNLLKQASKLIGCDNGDERLDKTLRSFFA